MAQPEFLIKIRVHIDKRPECNFYVVCMDSRQHPLFNFSQFIFFVCTFRLMFDKSIVEKTNILAIACDQALKYVLIISNFCILPFFIMN